MIETNFFLAISSFVSLGIGVVTFVWAIVSKAEQDASGGKGK